MPVMGYSTEGPHLCWKFWLLEFTILLLGICSPAVESSREYDTAVMGSGAHISMKGIQGGSILFHVGRNPGIDPATELMEITWSFGSGLDYKVMLQVFPLAHNVNWLGLQDKYQQRIRVLNSTALRIENLTSEDTGQYKAAAIFANRLELHLVFHLTVYEPVPLPQILVQSESITRHWCIITLECSAKGITEDMNVSWESQDLPMEREQNVTPGPAPKHWTLAMSLPLIQPNLSVICVVSNQVDQRSVTKNLVEVCSGRDGKAGIRRHILIIVMVIAALILGFGFYLWKTYWKKKMDTQRGSWIHMQHSGSEDDIQYADVIYPQHQENPYESIGQIQMESQESYTSVYSKVCTPCQPTKLT